MLTLSGKHLCQKLFHFSGCDGCAGASLPPKQTDTDAEKDTNHSVRENSNDTAYQLSETIRVNAQGILRGFKIIKQEVTAPQEVAVTIRWDKESEQVSNQLRKKFGN